MLRRLLQQENWRLAAAVMLALAVSLPLLAVAIALSASLSGRSITGFLICEASILGPMLLVWLAILYRFRWRSSVRGLTQSLACHGKPDDVLSMIDEELADPRRFELGQLGIEPLSPQPDGLILTANWLVRLCPSGSVVVAISDIAWIYRRVVASSGMVEMSRFDEQIGLVLTSGQHVHFDSWTANQTDRIIEETLERRPEILTGWRGEWIDLARDPVALAAEIETRRARFLTLTPTQREQWMDESWDGCQRFLWRHDQQMGPR